MFYFASDSLFKFGFFYCTLNEWMNDNFIEVSFFFVFTFILKDLIGFIKTDQIGWRL